MRKASLSAAERQIIESMLRTGYGPASDFLRQLAVARVDKRRLTGVGVFVDLTVPRSVRRVDQTSTELSTGCRTVLPAPADLVGFTLFIRNGVVSFLEGYTYGDVAWPEAPLEDWLVLDSVDALHQRAM